MDSRGCSSGVVVCLLGLFLGLVTCKPAATNSLSDDNHMDSVHPLLSKLTQIQNMISKRGKRDVTSYWKQPSEDRVDNDLFAMWKKRDKNQGAWQLPVSPKIDVAEARDGRFGSALVAFRDYLELQRALQARAEDQLNDAIQSKVSQEVVDKNMEGTVRASPELPKQQPQRRRQDPMTRPEFNPTGW